MSEFETNDHHPVLTRHVRDDQDLAEQALKTIKLRGTQVYVEFSESIRDNRDLAEHVLMRMFGEKYFPYMSARLRDDEKLVMIAIEKNLNDNFQYVSERLRQDPDFVQRAMRTSSLLDRTMPFVSESLRDDEGFMRPLIEKFGQTFCYASERLRSDKNLATLAVTSYPKSFTACSEGLRHDRILAKMALERYGPLYASLPNALRDDDELAWTALMSKGSIPTDIYPLMSERIRADHSIAEQVFSKTPRLFGQMAHESHKDDIDLAKKVVEHHPENFAALSPRLRDDVTLAIMSVKQDPTMFRFCSKRLTNDHEFVTEMVAAHPKLYKDRGYQIHDDLDLAMLAIKKQHNLFEYAGFVLQDDLTLATFAVEHDPENFRHASVRLRGDATLAKKAIDKASATFKFVASNLKDDENFVRFALQKNASLFAEASQRLRDTPDFAAEAVGMRRLNIAHVSNKLRDDRAFMERILIHDRNIHNTEKQMFSYAGECLRDDKEMALLAIECNLTNFASISPRLKDDVNVARRVLDLSPQAKEWRAMGPNVHDTKELALLALSKSGAGKPIHSLFEFVSNRLKDDIDVVKAGIAQSSMSFRHVSERLRGDMDVARFAIESDPENIDYVAPNIRISDELLAYHRLVLAERNDKIADLSRFPKPIQNAYKKASIFSVRIGTNNKKFREMFAIFAKAEMESEAKRARGLVDEPLKPSKTDPASNIADQLDESIFNL